MSFKEFLKDIKKVNKERHHKVTNSYGTKDAFFYYRKIRPKDPKYVLADIQYLRIIRSINDKLRELLIKGNDVLLPEKMGRLEIRKRNNSIKFKDGKLVTDLPINWDATLKLWYEDEESYNNRILIREENKETFRVYYNKNKANYNNKSFYQFFPNRELKIGLKNNIKKNKIEAFKYGN